MNVNAALFADTGKKQTGEAAREQRGEERMSCMNALSLFSGIGGLDLAAEMAGIRTTAMCERDSFCRDVLRRHWPNVPIYEDIRTLTGGGGDRAWGQPEKNHSHTRGISMPVTAI